jgi:hypothetical protein
MLWEMLVTDGHVRSARLRRVQPWIIALGIVLLWLGIIIIRMGPDLQTGTSAAGKLQERLMKLQEQAEFTFRKLPPLTMPADAQKSLPPAKEVAEVVSATLTTLNQSADLPDDVKFKEAADAEAFWKGDWGTEQIAYLRDGDNVLVGGNVSMGSPAYPQPSRWIGMFHRGENTKGEKHWMYASVVAGSQFAPRELQYVQPQQIALSLRPFLLEPPPPPKSAQPQ